MMKLEARASLTALTAGLLVVGASYGVSAIVTSHDEGKVVKVASSAQMGRNMGRMSAKMEVMDASMGAPQLVVQGRGLFTQACSSCHGAKGQGGYGPNLHGLKLPDTKIASVIKNGVQGKMPAYGNKYSAPQQQALVAYVQSLK